MKKIINGKLYDTDTARWRGSWQNGGTINDLNHVAESLYQKKTGEFFLHGEGGAMTKYAHAVGQNSWSGGERIMPLTYAEAKAWAEEYLETDSYVYIFGMPEEDDEAKAVLNIQIPAHLMAKLKARAAENATSVTATVEAMLTSLFDKE